MVVQMHQIFSESSPYSSQRQILTKTSKWLRMPTTRYYYIEMNRLYIYKSMKSQEIIKIIDLEDEKKININRYNENTISLTMADRSYGPLILHLDKSSSIESLQNIENLLLNNKKNGDISHNFLLEKLEFNNKIIAFTKARKSICCLFKNTNRTKYFYEEEGVEKEEKKKQNLTFDSKLLQQEQEEEQFKQDSYINIEENFVNINIITPKILEEDNKLINIDNQQQEYVKEDNLEKEERINEETNKIKENKIEVMGFNQFDKLKVIGKGSFATVFLVKHKHNNEKYCLKVISKAYIKEKKHIEHTLSERKVLIQMNNHPFILKMFHSFQTSSQLVFVTEYVPGGELFFHLRNMKKFKEEIVIFYICQVILALESLHALGIVYRDLKPENVLIHRDGFIKLADFGLSKCDVNNNDECHSFVGSSDYLAPEILNKNDYGKGVDYWTLGCLTHELLLGLPPFYSGHNRPLLFRKIREARVILPEHIISFEMCAFIKDLLQVSPERRLGMKGGVAIKEHILFKKYNVDWEKMLLKEVRPPYMPISKDEDDTSNFDSQFTSLPLVLPEDSNLMCSEIEEDDVFKGFEFNYLEK